jgi:hypothetical protein
MANLNAAEKESFSAQVAGILKEQETSDALGVLEELEAGFISFFSPHPFPRDRVNGVKDLCIL